MGRVCSRSLVEEPPRGALLVQNPNEQFPRDHLKKQVEENWDIKIDTQNVAFDRCAKANNNFKISKAFDKGATRLIWG
ncbi:hypothetical protein J1N35_025476 [Gossypium stocksii]|uniref:Uncharacterized protein n=1 Tax=Gossypium stocksii TaxID=47602 RepID=A0A9D3V7S4_9ROSI|nr:hypothetical protein J1N35_025476 [Gossypium stocksii]